MRRLPPISILVLVACDPAARSAPPVSPPPSAVAQIPSEPAAALPVEPTPLAPPIPEAPAWVASPPRPHVVDVLAQVPQSARFVVGLDVPRLARGPLGRHFGSMLSAVTVARPASCAAVTMSQFGQVVAAGVGTKGDHVVFLGPSLDERKAATCLTESTIKHHRATRTAIKHRRAFGSTVYFATAGKDAVAWTKKSGPIVVDREAWLLATLDPKAAKAAPELVALASSADHARTLWIAALVSADDLTGRGMPPGTLTGPLSLRLGFDLDADAELDIDLVFETVDAATQAVDYIRGELVTMQPDGADVRLGRHGTEVRMIMRLDAATVEGLLQRLLTR